MEFAEDVIRLRNKFSVKRGTLDPRLHVQYWDMVTGLALIFTAFVTPFGAPTALTPVAPHSGRARRYLPRLLLTRAPLVASCTLSSLSQRWGWRCRPR